MKKSKTQELNEQADLAMKSMKRRYKKLNLDFDFGLFRYAFRKGIKYQQNNFFAKKE